MTVLMPIWLLAVIVILLLGAGFIVGAFCSEIVKKLNKALDYKAEDLFDEEE